MNTERVLNSYGFLVLSSGTVSVLLSIFRLVSWLHLTFYFGYASGQVNLTIVSGTLDTFIWIIAVLIFLVYPIVIKERTLAMLLVHGAIPFSILLLLLSPEAFPVLAVNIMLAFAIAMVTSRRTFNISERQAAALVFSVVCLAIIPVEVLATFSVLSEPAALLNLYRSGSSVLLTAGRLSLDLFYFGGVAAEILQTLLMLSLIILIASSQRICGTWKALDGRSANPEPPVFDRTITTLIIGLAALAAFTAALPYLFHPVPMGVDASWYLENSAGHRSPLDLVREEPRALYLILLYVLRTTFQLTPVAALELGAASLSVLSVIGAFFFSWEAVHRADVALLSAFLASFSPQVLVATYAGIFEAWLAYSESLFFFGVLLYTMRNSNSKSAAGAVLLSVLIMLTHVWTWLLVTLILAGQVLVLVIESYRRHKLRFSNSVSRPLGVLLTSATIGGITLTLGTMALPTLAALNSTFYLFSSGLRSPMFFFEELSRTLTYMVGGFFSNWILISLAILGVFTTLYLASEVKALVTAWLLVPTFLSIFLSSDLQWRLLFLLPYSFLAALGVCFTLGRLRAQMTAGSHSFADSVLFYLLEYACLMAIGLIFWNNALRSMVLVSASF